MKEILKFRHKFYNEYFVNRLEGLMVRGLNGEPRPFIVLNAIFAQVQPELYYLAVYNQIEELFIYDD